MDTPESVDDFRVRAADDPESLLVVVIDTSLNSWVLATGKQPKEGIHEAIVCMQSVTEQLLVFMNTFLLLHESNRVCVITSGSDGAKLIYPIFPEPSTLPEGYAEDALLDPMSAYVSQTKIITDPEKMSEELRDAVVRGLRSSIHAQKKDAEICGRPSPISSALASALCLLDRARRIRAGRAALHAGGAGKVEQAEDISSKGRILTILAGHDDPRQYVPIMNCIFSAQRIGAPIDSCSLAQERDSTYFQQAAHLTNGVYLKPEGFTIANPDTLLQYLQTVFLVDRQSRDFLSMPTPERVDFRASCMQTRKIILDGYTCSVCLSTFDSSVGKGAAMCPICNARFAVSKARRRPPKV